jgi:hypothetical protein
MGDAYFSGRPPARSGVVLDTRKKGGHHLSPLSPTPWIQALLGLWSPRSRNLARDLAPLPERNVDVKQFLLGLIGPT